MKDKKRGNSDYRDRIELVKKFINSFGLESIQYLLGDREFIGKNWIEWLDQQQIPYVVRMKEKGQYISKRGERMAKATSLFQSLQEAKSKYIGKRKVGKTDTYLGHITGLKTVTNQMVILLHSAKIGQPCQLYRKRWEVELLFKVMKTSGFDLEATHLSQTERLDTLLAIVAISCCLVYRVGIYCISKHPPKLKKHGYKPFNAARYDLDLLIDMVKEKFLDKNTRYYLGSAEKVEKYMIIRYLEGRKGTTSARFLVNKVENVCIFTIHFCYSVVD